MNSSILRPFAATVLCLAVASAAPNYSGEWKLNAAKSNFGPMPAPDTMTQKIKHEEPNLSLAIAQAGQQGEFTYELKYTTDGKESTNTIRDNEMKSTAKWDGDALKISTKASFQGNPVSLDDKWTLSEDGKTLTVNRKINSAMGELEQTIVLEKQ